MENTDTLEQEAVKQVQAALNESKTQQATEPITRQETVNPATTPVETNSIDALLNKKKAEIEESLKVLDKKLHDLNMAGKSLAGQSDPQPTKEEKTKAEIKKLLENTGLNPFAGEGAKAL